MDIQQIKQALVTGQIKNKGRNSLFEEFRSAEKLKEIRENPFYSESIKTLTELGEKYLNEPIHTLLFSDYKIFDTTGSRSEYEKGYFDRRVRLNIIAALSILFGDRKYISALEDIIWAICDEYTWCVPAGFEGRSLNIITREDTEKNRNLHEHHKNIDLFAAETAFALAEICSLLEEKLTPLVVYRVRKNIFERVIDSYIESSFWWEIVSINWASVCCGSIGAAALHLMEDNDKLASLLHRVINSLECYLEGFGEDGATAEGLSYWLYGFGHYVYFSELLRQRTAGELDLLNKEKVKSIALFQQKCYLHEDTVACFSDAEPHYEFNMGLTNLLKKKFPEVEIPHMQNKLSIGFECRKRWGHGSRNLAWSSPDMAATIRRNAVYYLKDVQWLISRREVPNGTVAFAAKGGHNDEPHNHNDIGTFMLNINGEFLITDVGRGKYTKQYFGPERYTIFNNGSQGHSVPIINGKYQEDGRKYAARVIRQNSDDETDTFVLDMAGAYDDAAVSAVRSFEFIKTYPVRLVLKDTFLFSDKPGKVTERFISVYEPKLIAPGKAIIEGRKGSLTVKFDPGLLGFICSKQAIYNHQKELFDAWCMDLDVKNPGTYFTVQVIFEAN